MTHTTMLLSMTPTTQRQQVFQSIVSGFLRRCHAIAVDVVNVQVIFAAAVLAGVLVALQGGLAVTAEMVVVAGLVGVLFQAVFVRGKPVVDALNFSFTLARGAAVLRSCSVLKVIAAFGAKQDGSSGLLPALKAKLAQSLYVLFSPVVRLAGLADLLRRAGRLVGGFATDANFISVPAAGLTVSNKGARLAPLHVGRRLVEGFLTAKADERTVRFHDRHPEVGCFAS